MRPVFSSLIVLALAACNKAPSDVPASAAPAAPAVVQPSAPANAPSANGLSAAGGLRGTVLEALDAGGYTYLRLKTATGEQWAAVTQAKVAVGQDVQIDGAGEMRNFKSPTLGRTFASIFFGTLAGAEKAAAAAVPAAAPEAKTAAPAAAAASVEGVEKAKGPDGRRVSEVFADKARLKDRTVVVRGKVVKFNAGIMGRNWIHVRDGSGAEASGDHDLTVTTSGTAKVGDVVTVKGTVRLDRDFGHGYSYPVIVEEATVTGATAKP